MRRCQIPGAMLGVILLVNPLCAQPGDKAADPARLVVLIDARLDEVFQKARVKPAPPATDAEFLRRACLDITGRIPLPSEIYDYLGDKGPDKSRRLIDKLLADPRFAVHFANVWRAELLPELTSEPAAGVFKTGFEAWLRARFQAGTRYDALVRELVAVPLPSDPKDAEPVLRDPARPNPLAFLAVKGAQPDNLAAAVTRSFLGIQLECAQCHHHPFGKWKREQFWAQAAFFAGLQRHGNNMFAPLSENGTVRKIQLPYGKKAMQPAVFLDASSPDWKAPASPRQMLADWITAPENPYFARATVNRVWGHFFGYGLVDPVDDFRDDNPPSAPQLLDDLAKAFVAADYDLRFLIRAICQTQAYRRTSALTHPSQDTVPLPARMTVKALSGEQFFDSLAQATGYRDEQDKGAARRRFLAQFQLAGHRAKPETSVSQALTLLNGRFLAWATDPEKCPTLIAVTQMPGWTKAQRIEALYLATLSRPPRQDELDRIDAFARKGQRVTEAQLLADVFGVLLNSAEFRLNH
jgi:hypothetical protein